MVDKLDKFIEESKKLIGQEVVASPPSYTFVHKRAIVFFSIALGGLIPYSLTLTMPQTQSTAVY